MTTDRETAEVIRSWMKEETELNDAGVYRVLARLLDTPQRRHRWLWPFDWRPFARGATRSADTRGATPSGRFMHMFTATRVAAITAVLALGGSLVLVAGPLGPSTTVAPPGAEAPPDPMAPASFTGRVAAWESSDSVGETVELEDRVIDRWSTRFTNTMTDPRVTGSGRAADYVEAIVGDSETTYLSHSSSGYLENDGGAWAMSCTGAGDEGSSSVGVIACWYVGEGGYDGLTAFTQLMTDNIDSGLWDVKGWIFPGSPPPVLEFER